jgi:Right handed beta helix region/Fibronectin type III domain
VLRRLLVLAPLALVTAATAFAGSALATTYYVSAAGSDSAAGTAPTTAWRTIGRANNQALLPGDTVLFEGGATFGDTTLMPSRSGSSSTPITFGSYGTGRATIANANGAVWFSGKSWLTFDNLRLTSAGAGAGVFAGSGGGGSTHITLSNSVVTGTTGVGVIAPNTGDAYWTISGSTITQTGDSGLIMLGGPHTITRNTIADTGGNAAITYGKHGIYAKGPDQTISYNDFARNLNGQAISIRFHGARVFGNTIHDTPSAIAFFDYDTAAAPQGTSYVYGNRAWNVTDYGFYYAGESDPNGHAPTVDFVLASNTFNLTSTSAEAVNVSPSGSARVTLANNVFFGSYGSALRAASTTVEHHNLWSGASSNVPAGTGDVKALPALGAAPALTPLAGSPTIDRGSAANAGVTYTASCDGTPLSFCGAAPELGAIEAAAPAPAPAPTPVPTPAPAPLAPPTGLAVTAVGQTSLTLTWSAGGDLRTTGYEVLLNGTRVSSPVLTTAAVGGLTCGTAYTFAVRATAGTTVSASVATTAATAACPRGHKKSR